MVQILDSTLREGEQTPGVYFNIHIKLAIARLLDEIGVDYIEVGHPAVSKDIEYAVKQISQKKLNATVCAHSRTSKKDIDQALDCSVGFIGIFYCVSERRLATVHKKCFPSAVEKIVKTIRYAKRKNPQITVRYTPEDTVRSTFQNVLESSTAAVEAGADIISIADTTGYMVPGTERDMYNYVLNFKKKLVDYGISPKIAVHCHNDRGLALANALGAYRAGADIIDTAVLGLGERAGIVDLGQLLMTLSTDFNEGNWNLKPLPRLYSLVSKYSEPIPVNFPVTGKNAFTHCAGIHTHAATIDPLHYQSLDPAPLGRKTEISLDHMSGISSVRYALEQIGEEAGEERMTKVLERVKRVGQKGRTVSPEELKHIVSMYKKEEKR
ncbi:MAG: 2-isopropylmalate synthase [Euryarchaeota archaeon]|nr:2-isopropylmalate synthase [Euryarchaeota archaeon]